MAKKQHPLLNVRGFHKFKRKMYYLSEDGTFRLKLGVGFNALFDRQPEPKRNYKLSWFTGLCDAKRKRIYEGDRLLGPNSLVGAVVFSHGVFWLEAEGADFKMPLYLVNPKKNGYVIIG